MFNFAWKNLHMDSPQLHLANLRRLLQIEYEEEKQAFAGVTDRIGFVRLCERGDAWLNVVYQRSYINSLNRRVVEITRNKSDDVDESHNFEYGKPVMFFTLDAPDGRTPTMLFGGTVSFAEADRMVVAVADGASVERLASARALGVMLSFDETSYRAMFEALDRTAAAKGRLGELRDLIYSHRVPATLTPVPLTLPYLNADQQAGVNAVIRAKDVAVVHGPPGTGKTTTLVEAIYETLRRESQVLVCAQSNSAVDLICERLSERGINVLRIGNPSRVTDSMLACTYERRFESHPDYPTLWNLRRTIRQLRSHRKSSDNYHQKLSRLKDRAVELELRINSDIFSRAHVIASTLVGSNSRLLDNMKFSTLFIDEAAQALEAAAWIAIRRAGRVVFAGDHCQLPPTVKSYEAQRQGLAKSLMEVIVERHPQAVTLLTTQYRMHEQIMQFSSRWFYGGCMQAAPEVRYRGILDFDTPVEWVDSANVAEAVSTDEGDAFREALAGQSHGRINRDEALLTIQVLDKYLNRIGHERILAENIDIAVISPYRAQVRYLRSLISTTENFRSLRRLIKVDTVDGFQGRESDVVIISMVRANDTGQIGFLRDLRRMNVAMTRARSKLIIIGHAPTLSKHPFYNQLYNYIASIRE